MGLYNENNSTTTTTTLTTTTTTSGSTNDINSARLIIFEAELANNNLIDLNCIINNNKNVSHYNNRKPSENKYE